MQSETGFPSSHQLKSYVAYKSRLKLAARAVLSEDAGLLVLTVLPFSALSLLVGRRKWHRSLVQKLEVLFWRNPDNLQHTHNCFRALFPGPLGQAGARRNLLLDFMVQGKITETDTPTIRLGATPSGLISDSPPSSPIFGSRPSDHYFRSVCLSVCLFVCAEFFFSRLRSDFDQTRTRYMSGSSCTP